MADKWMVLLVDRDRENLAEMRDWLGAEGYRTAAAEDGVGALRQFFSLHPDTVIVDIGLGDMSSWDVIERIRGAGETPVIVISSDISAEDVSRALETGLDGFLVKPLDGKELTTRVNEIRRRHRQNDLARWVYRCNGLVIDKRSCEVLVDGKPVQLTATEYKLLSYLVDRRGWVVSHDQILANVWGESYTGDRNQVKLYMWYLRRKLRDDPKNPKIIRTKRGLGYSFVG